MAKKSNKCVWGRAVILKKGSQNGQRGTIVAKINDKRVC